MPPPPEVKNKLKTNFLFKVSPLQTILCLEQEHNSHLNGFHLAARIRSNSSVCSLGVCTGMVILKFMGSIDIERVCIGIMRAKFVIIISEKY